jgi:hypothetical protein
LFQARIHKWFRPSIIEDIPGDDKTEDPYMKILRDSNSDVLQSNNFIMRSVHLLLVNMVACYGFRWLLFQQAIPERFGRTNMMIRGMSTTVLYSLISFFAILGT